MFPAAFVLAIVSKDILYILPDMAVQVIDKPVMSTVVVVKFVSLVFDTYPTCPHAVFQFGYQAVPL